ncbi:hypothetical protein HOLleu_03050 [Holothuria leucospilota]|uniref:DUF6729 domain-containing protein n=1 Tax=Holothuria leucospilota TaxID=206669 RepID=A0A9Q1HLM8_HOLLE|nr:hypothetical protein HOLleu_03050 [Holothuria leucospilota]
MASAPNIRVISKGDMVMKVTSAADEAKKRYRSRPTAAPFPMVKALEEVDRDARDALHHVGIHEPDDVTLLGEYKIQRGQYYNKTFKWVLENDAGYALYLWREHLKGPSPGKTEVQARRATANLEALVRYVSKFQICRDTHHSIVAGKAAELKAKETGDPGFNTLGFGKYHRLTYKQMQNSADKEHQKYCKWILNKTGIMKGSSMHRFQLYLKNVSGQASSQTSTGDVKTMKPPVNPSVALAGTSTSSANNSETETSRPATASTKGPSASMVQTPACTSSVSGLSTVITNPCTPPPPRQSSCNIVCDDLLPHDQSTVHEDSVVEVCDIHTDGALASTSATHDVTAEVHTDEVLDSTNGQSWQRFCSKAQEEWMKAELKTLGLLPGTREYLDSSRWQGQPLWRSPPPGELQPRFANQLQRPEPFWIHPMFVWSPETMCQQLMGTTTFPCITSSCKGQAEKRGVGKPRLIVGSGGGNTGMPNTGQYYIVASTLYCRSCKCSPWASDQPAYLKMLPLTLQNLFPAHITYRKAVCRTLVDEMRRSGRSPADMAKQTKELLQLRYERAHNQYLSLVSIVRKQAQRNKSLDAHVGLDVKQLSIPFGTYSDPEGYRGADVSEQFLSDILISEYEDQKPYLYGLLKGVYGRYWRSDHTRTIAKKWSYSVV